MSARRKTYWQSCVVRDGSEAVIKAWFAPLADRMVPYQADILCDVETDKALKLRAYMTDECGRKCAFTRSLGGKRYHTTTMQPLADGT
jgi:hypothetical protein